MNSLRCTSRSGDLSSLPTFCINDNECGNGFICSNDTHTCKSKIKKKGEICRNGDECEWGSRCVYKYDGGSNYSVKYCLENPNPNPPDCIQTEPGKRDPIYARTYNSKNKGAICWDSCECKVGICMTGTGGNSYCTI